MGSPATGAARQFAQSNLGGPTNELESTPTVTTTVSQVVNANGDRVGLLIMNIGTDIAYIGLSAQVSSSFGIELAAGGGVATFTVRDDFTLPARQWMGVAQNTSTVLYVLEEVRITLNPPAVTP